VSFPEYEAALSAASNLCFGWVRSLATGEPSSDAMHSWRIPADRLGEVEDILSQKAPQPVTQR
jgi:hypothetical protein